MNRMTSEFPIVRSGMAAPDPNARGFVLLCRRRTGGRALMRLLSAFSEVPVLPDQPFLWHNPLGAISREFYTGDRRSALAELNAAMARPASFVHIYEVDGRGFNVALLDALAANDRKVVLFDRADEVARAFSRVVTGHFGLDTRDAMAEFRRRLNPTAPVPGEIFTKLEEQVLWDLDYERWMQKELAQRNIALCTSSTEKVFSCGVDGLEEFDRIAAFAGLANTRARVGERVLLDRLTRGAHYTESLVGLSPAFAALRQRIADILATR